MSEKNIDSMKQIILKDLEQIESFKGTSEFKVSTIETRKKLVESINNLKNPDTNDYNNIFKLLQDFYKFSKYSNIDEEKNKKKDVQIEDIHKKLQQMQEKTVPVSNKSDKNRTHFQKDHNTNRVSGDRSNSGRGSVDSGSSNSGRGSGSGRVSGDSGRSSGNGDRSSNSGRVSGSYSGRGSSSSETGFQKDHNINQNDIGSEDGQDRCYDIKLMKDEYGYEGVFVIDRGLCTQRRRRSDNGKNVGEIEKPPFASLNGGFKKKKSKKHRKKKLKSKRRLKKIKRKSLRRKRRKSKKNK